MRKLGFFIAVSMCLIITACSSEKYSVNEKEIVIEVKTYTTEKEKEKDDIKFFDPLSYLALNEKELTNEQKEEIVVSSNVDCDKIGEYEISFKKDDKELLEPIKVKVVDTTKAKISLTENEFQVGTDITEKIEFSDNYDDAETLKDNLRVDGYDSESSGEQEITISLKDSSGNETIEKFTITLTETPKEDQKYDINDVPYAPGQSGGGSSSGGSAGNSGGSSGNSGGSSGNSGGNSGSSGGGWTPPVEQPVAPTPPPAACPGGMDPSLPCDWTPNNVGNTGLIFNTMEDAYKYGANQGWARNEYSVGALNYNGNYTKYTITKY